MSLFEKLNAIKDTVPHYWPIGTFIHHNPLKGFEHLHFKDALFKVQDIFEGKVYMDSDYYVRLFSEGKISTEALEKNLLKVLKEAKLEKYGKQAKTFLLEVSPLWSGYRNYEVLKTSKIDETLHHHLQNNALYEDKGAWIVALTKHMTLYEIHDALFETSKKELIEKDVIEFVARFLDQQQTTLSMTDRDLGMFETFKLYENIDYIIDVEAFVQEALDTLKVQDAQTYFLTHLLKLHGWAGYIKYRSEAKEYFPQLKHPSTLMDYIAIRLHFEVKYLRKKKVNDFEKLHDYIKNNTSHVILKFLQAKGKLTGIHNDAMEEHQDYREIVDAYIKDEINLDSLQVQLAQEATNLQTMMPVEFAHFAHLLKKEEGFIWLKSLEDSYIKIHTDAFTSAHHYDEKPLSSTVFCLDVRSEVIRRKIEQSGSHTTYGAGGFMGIPLSFVEFDKPHALLLAPAVIRPNNIVFEVPTEAHEAYNIKKDVNKTTKKVLGDLKNNPYTPYIMVEAIGWLFGFKLFGKTFFPQKTHKIFSRSKPLKPKTTYTLDKLSPEEVEKYVKRLHTNIINEVITTQFSTKLNASDISLLWEHLVCNQPLKIRISSDIINTLKQAYHITSEDYEIQKTNLAKVGFTPDEQIAYVENLLKMIGLVESFPKFVIITGHGSCSDNNPFESALDCGACGGSISLPNARTLCMLANRVEIRERLIQKGIVIPKETHFVPALHNTTTDEITFYDTDILDVSEFEIFSHLQEDFTKASRASREERVKVLPNANSARDLFTKTMDWSEPRPEWGLAGNMGVFVGPRDSCRHMPLYNRLFLHSYNASIDSENADILTHVFNGSLVVGQWINLEHYFSTVDNKVYGAGSKVYHNIVSKIGVYSGNYSDLKIGLPSQSVLDEGKAYHEPLRLLTYIEAPLEMVAKAVENSVAKQFILNEWIRPIVIDKAAKKVYSYEHGEFIIIKELE